MKYINQLLLSVSKFFLYLFVSLPKSVHNFCGDAFGLLWFDVFRIRRKTVLDNIEIAFPEMSESERIKLGRSSLRKLGRNFVSYTRMPFFSEKEKDEFRLVNKENYDMALAKGKGVCLLSLHLGNVDRAASGLCLYGYKLHVISKLLSIKWLESLWFGMREKRGMVFIPPRGSSYGVLKALKKKESVVFVLDQFTGPPYGVKTQFFGRNTGSSMGLATIVQRSKAPVIPVYSITEPDGTVVVFFDPEIDFEEKETREKSIHHMTQVYTDKLESLVKKHPEEWMWIHRRWKPHQAFD